MSSLMVLGIKFHLLFKLSVGTTRSNLTELNLEGTFNANCFMSFISFPFYYDPFSHAFRLLTGSETDLHE